MEFWGAEVKSGEPLKVQPGDGMVLHLSQASVGEVKKDKGSESVCLFVNVDGKKLVLGTLFSDKLPQQQFDLVFDRDFELSHNWKAGSVFFYGYKASNPYEDEVDGGFGSDSESDSDDEEEEDIPLIANNGKSEIKVKQEKPLAAEKVNAGKESGSGKQKVKIVEPNKDVKPEEDSDDSDDDESNDDMDSDEDMQEGEDESDSDENEESEDEETPKKVQSGKKRAPESAIKTPIPGKKAKVVTPQKTDGKKGGGHVATPHPSKQVGKTPANKSNQQTPKSGGSITCGSCKKTFGTENALQSHAKAKHSAGK